MNTALVDFHCHLDLYPDYDVLFTECDRKAIHTLAVTTTPKAWGRNRQLAAQTDHVRVALGIHPQLIRERASEFDLWKELLPQTRYVGEVGLDASPQFYKSFEIQKQIFQQVLIHCAAAGEKILSVHSVRSAGIILDMIESHLVQSSSRAVLHWFSGSPKEAKRAVDLGCYFSINAEMLKSERHLAVLKEIPETRILTETDGPFTMRQGRPSRPDDIADVLERLSRVMNISMNDLSNQILCNLNELET